ncbi:hypothetical protein BG006_006537 [Podila minutissima]|uniref:Peptidase S8/S53 domain-containing protein n=1 Tax=Podila minutissima TaxID=64525 RepID=A0A9P5VLA0_9FUNG|nr:hypothetical protein BG006_006537 [Podila minutissima]
MSINKKNIGDVVPGEFIIVLKDGSFVQKFQDKVNSVDDHDAKLLTAYKAILACCATLSTNMVQEFKNDDNVAYIEQVRVVGLKLPDASLVTTAMQPDDLWNLNRVCERKLGVKCPSHAPATGKGITEYVVDTGVYTDHQEFNGRASWGANFVPNSEDTDEYGHGTYVAGTIGGSTYCVAKEVSIVSVKVLDARGSGTIANVLAGLDWVVKNAIPGKSVVDVPGGGGKSRAIDDIIKRLYNKSIPVFVAAGTDPSHNSGDGSPSGSPYAYTVASMDWLDQPSRFNSPGKNVDIFCTGLNPGLEAIEVYEYLSKNATSGSLSGDLKGMPNLIVYNNPNETTVA